MSQFQPFCFENFQPKISSKNYQNYLPASDSDSSESDTAEVTVQKPANKGTVADLLKLPQQNMTSFETMAQLATLASLNGGFPPIYPSKFQFLVGLLPIPVALCTYRTCHLPNGKCTRTSHYPPETTTHKFTPNIKMHFFSDLIYNQILQQMHSTSSSTIEPSTAVSPSATKPSASPVEGTGEQPLDLSAKPSSGSPFSNDPKHVFR